jgi:hypothetical protein
MQRCIEWTRRYGTGAPGGLGFGAELWADVSAHPAAARLQAPARTRGWNLDADDITYRITRPLLLDVIHAAAASSTPSRGCWPRSTRCSGGWTTSAGQIPSLPTRSLCLLSAGTSPSRERYGRRYRGQDILATRRVGEEFMAPLGEWASPCPLQDIAAPTPTRDLRDLRRTQRSAACSA